MQLLTTQKTVASSRPDQGSVQPGSYTWFASPAELVTLEPSADGITCIVRPVGPPGTVDIISNALRLNGSVCSGFNTLEIVEPDPITMIVTFSPPEPL